MRLRTALTAVLAAGALAVAGCGGGEPKDQATAPPASTAPATTTAPATVPTLTPEQAARRVDDDGALLVDVRENDEWSAGHAPEATHVPLAEVPGALAKLDAERDGHALIFICRSGNRSARATQAALDAGLENVHSVEGGMAAWVAAGLPLKPKDGSII